MKLTLIIPAFNEERVITQVLRNAKKELSGIPNLEIVVVDDGSSDATSSRAQEQNVTVLRHPINRGLGGALGTGLEYAKRHNTDIAVTFDADGQHDAKDIRRVIEPIVKNKADVVIGSRTLEGFNKIPFDRKVIILLSNVVTRLLYGLKTTDSQSGFRAFSRTALQLLNIKTQGMEVSTEFFSEIKTKKLECTEIPISVIYSEYSRSKGQSNLNAFSVLARLLLRIAR